MIEHDKMKSLKEARRALALASWSRARAIPAPEASNASRAEPPREDQSLPGALQRFREARRVLAQGRRQHRATLIGARTDPEAAGLAAEGGFEAIGADLERCAEEISRGDLERLAPAEAL